MDKSILDRLIIIENNLRNQLELLREFCRLNPHADYACYNIAVEVDILAAIIEPFKDDANLK